MRYADWTQKFRTLYDKALAYYGGGQTDPGGMFNQEETAFLKSIGMTAQNLFDYAEDWTRYNQPDWDTVLLITAARRDYFLHAQRGVPTGRVVTEPELPAKTAELEGIAWLPRIIMKARAFLAGELTPEIMYGCGGDRRFLAEHDIHPADFLRVVWASHGDDAKILSFVRASKAGTFPQSA